MKSIKEKRLLVKWAKAMNEPVDPVMVEEVERYEQTLNEIVESVKLNSLDDLIVAAKTVPVKEEIYFPVPPTVEEVLETLKEEVIEQPKEIKPKSLVEKAAEHITKEVKLEEKADSYQQPDAQLTGRSVNDIRKKIKFLEDWVAKISLTGPGGGAGNTIDLNYPVKLITGDYTLTRNDYYIGVNAAAVVNITIPNTLGSPGRKLVIKDESGRCSKFPIIVSGNVDNDAGGFILKIDNGAIQMIYRDGWRII